MKKLFLILFLCFFALNASAGVFSNCTEFQGRNGKRYCKGGSETWFRCFSWCDAQGLKFASVFDICDYSNESFVAGTINESCANFDGAGTFPSGLHHTASSCGAGKSSCVINGNMFIVTRSKTEQHACICMFPN